MRHAHYIKSNRGCETPHNAIWLDCESRQEKNNSNGLDHILTFGYAAHSRRNDGGTWTKTSWQRFEDNDTLYDFVDSKAREKSKLYVFCHNTNFDLPLTDVFGAMKSRGYTLKGAIIDGPPTILNFRRDKKTVIFLDTLNFFRVSLSELGKRVGLEKYEEKDKSGSMIFDDKRCRRDVEIIMKSMKDWWELLKDQDLGGFANTLAGQSFRTFRHRFMSHDILIDNNENALRVARAAYYGGRTEAFMIGKYTGKFELLDLVSAYPSKMRGEKYPARIKTFSRSVKVDELHDLIEKYCICADVEIYTDDPAYPTRMNDRLVFPTGHFRAYLSTPEIKYAIEHGHIVKVNAVAIYHAEELFTPFVDFFIEKRMQAKQRGDDTTSFLYKILMNSLYGKFGQRGSVWEREKNTEDLSARSWLYFDTVTKEVTKWRRFGGIIQYKKDDFEARESHPAIAAHVTAHVRMWLWSLINTAGRENIYYCDTDSLLCNRKGFGRLKHMINPDALGGLSHDGTYDHIEIRGAKDYTFGEKTRIKGIKKSAIWLDEKTAEQDQWSSLKGLLRSGSMTVPTTKKVMKTLSREYKKGHVTSSGKIIPFELAMERPVVDEVGRANVRSKSNVRSTRRHGRRASE